MAGISLVRRTTAVVAATALLSAAGLASGALVGIANAATVTSVKSPSGGAANFSNAATTATPFTINGLGFVPVPGPGGSSVSLVPTTRGDDAAGLEVKPIPGTIDYVNSSTTVLKVTAPLHMVAPEHYNVVVAQSGSASSTCLSCLLVTNPDRPTVTGVVKDSGDGFMIISGTLFAIGAKVSFLNQDLLVDPAMTFTAGRDTSSGHTTGYPDTTTIKGHYTRGASPATGKHYLKVTNLDGQGNLISASQFVEFWQPAYTSTGPAALGQGATNVPVTIVGDGIRAGSVFGVSQPSSTASEADMSVGTATVAGDNKSVTAPVSVGTNGGTNALSARTVTITGPDGGYVNAPSALTVHVAPFINDPTASFPPPPAAITPSTLGQGGTVLATITGSDFTGLPTFTFDGDGVTAVTNSADGTSAQVSITAAPGASIGGHNVTVTNPDHGSYTTTGDGTPGVAPFPLTINAGPLVTAVSPNSTSTSQTNMTVNLSGTGFDTNGMTAAFGPGSGITVNSVTVNSATSATLSINVSSSASGSYDVVVTNTADKGRTTCAQCFGIDSLSLANSSGPNTNHAFDQTFTTSASTPFTGAPTVVLHKTGSPAYQPDIAGTVTSTTPTTLAATFDLDTAAPGLYNAVVTIAPGNTRSCTGCFTITAKSFSATGVTPATGGQGAIDFPITLHGTSTATAGFSRGETMVIPGTTVSATTYVDPTTLTATITIPAGTAPGLVNLTVNSADGAQSQTLTNAYTIVTGPTVTGAPGTSDHKNFGQGATSRALSIGGTGFTASSRVSFSGTGVTTTITSFTATLLNATVTVAATAATGDRDVVVTNIDNGGRGSKAGLVTITSKPIPSDVSPASLMAGKSTQLRISGQGFQSDSVVVITGVTLSGTSLSDGVLTTSATVPANAPTGARSVKVQNTDGGTGICSCTFTVVPAPLILGGNVQRPLYGSTFVIRGTAPAGDVVLLHFHKSGTAANDYSLVRSATANSSGSWTRAILANTDYRYYATDGSATSNNVLFQPRPTVSGPLTRVVAKNHTTSISGTSVPGTTVYVHFHKAGTAAGDYSIVRAVTANSSGAWTKSFLASVDYRIFASRAAGDSVSGYTTYVFQAR